MDWLEELTEKRPVLGLLLSGVVAIVLANVLSFGGYYLVALLFHTRIGYAVFMGIKLVLDSLVS